MPERSYTSDAGTDESFSTKGITFTLDGVTFACDGTFDPNDMMDLAVDLQDATPTRADPSALGTIGYLIRAIMGEDTWLAFRAHRRQHHTRPEVIGQIMNGLIEDLAGLPTTAPSPSPGGRRKTGPSPKAVSSSPGRRHKPGRDLPAGGDLLTVPAPGTPPDPEDGPPVHRKISLATGQMTVEDLAG